MAHSDAEMKTKVQTGQARFLMELPQYASRALLQIRPILSQFGQSMGSDSAAPMPVPVPVRSRSLARR